MGAVANQQKIREIRAIRSFVFLLSNMPMECSKYFLCGFFARPQARRNARATLRFASRN